ncbi:MAG: hypothetical protein DRP45_05715 [Candidatus Zixiibacteriota bacterium]|nr:MAG: hypothetical protein DRP45_05715 [candidate division Zixibacteria bacterium]
MMASLYSGVSGMKNHQVKLNVIGNNIANVNTIGYKSGRVNFREALVQTYKGASRPSTTMGGTNPQQLGLGMQVATVDNLFLQGGLETTGQITDLAIQGSGFFILGDNNGNSFYSRAGAFGFDADSNLVDPATGLFVQGKMADSSGVIPSSATIGNIQLPFGQQDPARETDVVTLANNIDVSATDSVATLVSAGGSNVVTASGTAIDGVGGRHEITITGNQAVNATYTGVSVGDDGTGNPVANLTANMTLNDLGITVFDDFGMTVDGGSEQLISGLSATSTIQDLINSISGIDGVTAELVGGQVQITRDKAGSNADLFFTSSASSLTVNGNGAATAGNIVGVVFGIAAAGTFSSAGGAESTFAGINTFTPNRGYGVAAGPIVTNLENIVDANTGMVTGLSGIDGGGITITTGMAGLTATGGDNLIIDTADTTHSASINVFDSQGGKHTLSIEFFKSVVPNRWEWSVSTTGQEDITAGGYGYVSFNSDGSLNTFDYFGGSSGVTIDPNTGADLMHLRFDAGTIGEFDGLTGFAQDGNHRAAIINQDGYGLGMLEKIDIDQTGNIFGIFSNGVTRNLAQILLADFNNQAGLRKAGRSLWQTSPNSGPPVDGVAGSTISAMITSGALEASSVDIAQEFTSMITAQRGFQANARIITTSDHMLDELVNLKR